MIYLDTSTCIGLLRGDISVSPATMRSVAPTELGIPVVVESELLIAAAQSRDAERNTQIVRQFLLPFEKVPYDSSCCNLHCRIRLHLESAGAPTGTNIIIAAMAMRHDATLLTCSPNLYRRIPGLKMVECGNDLEESLRLCEVSGMPANDGRTPYAQLLRAQRNDSGDSPPQTRRRRCGTIRIAFLLRTCYALARQRSQRLNANAPA